MGRLYFLILVCFQIQSQSIIMCHNFYCDLLINSRVQTQTILTRNNNFYQLYATSFSLFSSETNLKVRQPLMETFNNIKTDKDLSRFKGKTLICILSFDTTNCHTIMSSKVYNVETFGILEFFGICFP